MRELVVTPVSCYDLNNIENYKLARNRRHLLLDEIGVETNLNDYGEKFNPVERLINLSEDENKALFCSTNLSLEQLFNRYGKRAFDRLAKRCKIIEFTTKSLR
jgi:DNA replication protein DnaC